MNTPLRFALSVFAAFAVSISAQAASQDQVMGLMSAPFTTSTEAGQSIGQMARYFETQGDRRGQFARIYAITITATAQHIARGSFENPVWVESLIVNYANIYRKTIHKELAGRRNELPVAWQYEFEFAASDRWMATFDVIYGIKVHITRDLVEALYITPTDFSDESLRRDFFRISTVLKLAMPEIWDVYVHYSRSLPLVSVFTESAVYNWIARLRAAAWEDARTTIHLSAQEKTDVLNRLDRDSESVRHFGILTILH